MEKSVYYENTLYTGDVWNKYNVIIPLHCIDFRLAFLQHLTVIIAQTQPHWTMAKHCECWVKLLRQLLLLLHWKDDKLIQTLQRSCTWHLSCFEHSPNEITDQLLFGKLFRFYLRNRINMSYYLNKIKKKIKSYAKKYTWMQIVDQLLQNKF